MNIFKGIIVSLAALAIVATPALATGNNNGNDKVTICHATSSEGNPYVQNQPSKSGDVNGHDGHDNDIIPAFGYNHEHPGTIHWHGFTPHFHSSTDHEHEYAGKNWDEEGQAIWNNDCNIPEPPRKDVCDNIEGIQEETPEGYVNDEGQCTKEEEPPVEEPKEEEPEEEEPVVENEPVVETPVVESLPDTSGGWLLYGLMGLGLTGIGAGTRFLIRKK
jgi:hypothetical protein